MRFHAVLVAVALGAAPAMIQAQEMDHDMGGQALMQANQRMMDAMDGMEPSGDTDKDFALMMIEHHKGAIEMAEVELEHGDDPQMRALAENVIAEQQKEIADMEEWLSQQAE